MPSYTFHNPLNTNLKCKIKLNHMPLNWRSHSISFNHALFSYILHLPFIHSFHYGDLYSAPSRLLLRSAPDPCTAKKKSFETRVECVRKNPGEQYSCPQNLIQIPPSKLYPDIYKLSLLSIYQFI